MTLPICPKCAYQRLPTDAWLHEGVCPSCGIAYQKYLDLQQGRAPAVAAPLELEEVPPPLQVLKARLLEPPARVDGIELGGRALAWCAFALWTIWFASHGVNWEVIGSSFLHQIILPFHEFGHVLFRPLGRFMTILGGSLFQVLMPLGLTALFLIRQRDTFGASATLWWCGQSLVDLSPYIRDAPYRALPLVGGGDESGHDWGNLLTMTGQLAHSEGIARLSFVAGVVVMLVALAWGALLLRLQYAKMKAR